MKLYNLPRSLLFVFLICLFQLSACAKEVQTEYSEVKIEPEQIQQIEKLAPDVIESDQFQEVLTPPSVEGVKDLKEAQESSPVTVSSVEEAEPVSVEAAPSPDTVLVSAPVPQQNIPAEVKAENQSPAKYTSPPPVPVMEELSSAQELLNLAQYRGKVVYLDFWASWCGPCKQSFPWMQKMHNKYPDDLVILAVNLDAKMEDAEKFLAAHDVDFKIIFDPLWQAGREYGIYGLPYSFVYNRAGELVGKHGGFASGDNVNLEAALNNLFALGE